jgi:hypothetical protein
MEWTERSSVACANWQMMSQHRRKPVQINTIKIWRVLIPTYCMNVWYCDGPGTIPGVAALTSYRTFELTHHWTHRPSKSQNFILGTSELDCFLCASTSVHVPVVRIFWKGTNKLFARGRAVPSTNPESIVCAEHVWQIQLMLLVVICDVWTLELNHLRWLKRKIWKIM